MPQCVTNDNLWDCGPYSLLHGASVWGRSTVILTLFQFLSCCPLTKLLAHPSHVQAHNFVPGILRQLLGLAHGGQVSYTVDEFKQVQLIQVIRSGGQQGSSKTNWEVCESWNSCCLVGGQILLSCHKIQIHFSKMLQCDFRDICFF